MMPLNQMNLKDVIQLEQERWYYRELLKVRYLRGEISLEECLQGGRARHAVPYSSTPGEDGPIAEHYRRKSAAMSLIEAEEAKKMDSIFLKDVAEEDRPRALSDFLNELSGIRREIQREYGSSFEDFCYRSYHVYSFSADDMLAWSKYIETDVVPVLRRAIAERETHCVEVSKDPTSLPGLIITAVKACEGGEEIGDFIAMLHQSGRLDILRGEHKKPGLSVFREEGDSLTSLYMWLKGTSAYDFIAVAHELGHAWYKYRVEEAGKVPNSIANEITAFLFEALAVQGAKEILPPGIAEEVRYYHLVWAVMGICDLAKVALFERELLSGTIEDEAAKSALWRELSDRFDIYPGLAFGENQAHIIHYPFFDSIYGIARGIQWDFQDLTLLKESILGEELGMDGSYIYDPKGLREHLHLKEAKAAMGRIVSRLEARV